MKSVLSAPVLVLNANFEPIHVCNVRRAISLILDDKASMVLDGRGEIRTVRQSYPCPSIIRLGNMVKRPRPIVKLTSQEVFRRDNYTCQYCGKRPSCPTLDHVVPRRLGGGHTWENLITCCPSCNHRKGGRTLEHAHMKLLHAPQKPSASTKYIFGKHICQNDEWIEFVEGW